MSIKQNEMKRLWREWEFIPPSFLRLAPQKHRNYTEKEVSRILEKKRS